MTQLPSFYYQAMDGVVWGRTVIVALYSASLRLKWPTALKQVVYEIGDVKVGRMVDD